MDTIRSIRKLDDKHNFSLLCHSFAQLGELVIIDNHEFRTMKALTPRTLHVHPAGGPRRSRASC